MILSEGEIKAICSKKPNARNDTEIKQLEKCFKNLIKHLELKTFEYLPPGRKDNRDIVVRELRFEAIGKGII